MNITLIISHESERWNPVCQATIPERWVGTTPTISFGGNTVLKGEEYPIRLESFQQVNPLDAESMVSFWDGDLAARESRIVSMRGGCLVDRVFGSPGPKQVTVTLLLRAPREKVVILSLKGIEREF